MTIKLKVQQDSDVTSCIFWWQDILTQVEALLYVDTDILFLRPLEDIWKFFDQFTDSHIAALAPEHEEPTASWYARFARHPYVPPYGQSVPMVSHPAAVIMVIKVVRL